MREPIIGVTVGTTLNPKKSIAALTFTDHGNGKVTISANSAEMKIKFTERSEGKVFLEVI